MRRVFMAVVVMACLVGTTQAAQDKAGQAPAAPAVGQAKPATPAAEATAAPVVTELMAAQFQAAFGAREVWNLKVYQARAEFERASEQLDKLMTGWVVPGYDLQMTDQGKLQYVAKAPAPPAPATKPPKSSPQV